MAAFTLHWKPIDRRGNKAFQFRLSNGKVISDCSALCGKCSSQLTQSKQPNKYIDNNLSAGLVPECLQSLDIIQRRLISQIQSFMTIIILPGGQYAEKGLAIHFPLDMESYFKSLQTFQNENVLLVAYSNKRPQLESIPVAKVVDNESVRTAILWLKENNILCYGFPDNNNTSVVCSVLINKDEEFKELTLFTPQVEELLQEPISPEKKQIENNLLSRIPMKIKYIESPKKTTQCQK
ncbi:unnamed protein product [Mytilus edulis]|uniref:DUF6570 domain-containing protein n=1 Tax=Mytilus edulis TaxID=6550 RepID=A0A8S3U8K3_MYTED|nr:unnamed protein product [Mytilus edulis]